MPEGKYGNYHGIKSMREEPDLSYLLKISKQETIRLNRALKFFPLLDVEYNIRPVAQTILKIDVVFTPNFIYSKQFHMGRENFWVIVDNGYGEILHNEQFSIQANSLVYGKRITPVEISFYLPFKGGKRNYVMSILSDRFVGADKEVDLDLSDIMIYTEKMEYTDLLNLRPLPIATLHNAEFEEMYAKFKYFNPVQTQVFFAMYHTDNNVIVGSPTGSGKTIICELAILRNFANTPSKKVVYVAPYKALAKERIRDWKKRFGAFGKSVLELTGDYTPDLQALIRADVLVVTPEKWDGVSRNWQQRNYVQQVGLIIFDEIHLLGQDRGPVIEVIVSRMGYISKKLNTKIRMVGLSTAMANGADVANWFGVPKGYLFNFRPNVRPVPVEIHFKGFAGKNYCPRMNSMNKPAFNDIHKFSPNSPVLVSLTKFH
jgi:activating signal cointegrator complex subunit 3